MAALMLAVVLALGSITMAVARGQAAPGETMVICSGYGVVTLTLDENGNPTGPVHPCPDCLAGLGLAVLGETPAILPPARLGRALDRPATLHLASRAAPAALARGPPLPV
jgi:hypothetical protein